MSFVVSVLPAPDSPLTRMDCDAGGPPSAVEVRSARYAASATANTCGDSSPSGTPAYWRCTAARQSSEARLMRDGGSESPPASGARTIGAVQVRQALERVDGNQNCAAGCERQASVEPSKKWERTRRCAGEETHSRPCTCISLAWRSGSPGWLAHPAARRWARERTAVRQRQDRCEAHTSCKYDSFTMSSTPPDEGGSTGQACVCATRLGGPPDVGLHVSSPPSADVTSASVHTVFASPDSIQTCLGRERGETDKGSNQRAPHLRSDGERGGR